MMWEEVKKLLDEMDKKFGPVTPATTDKGPGRFLREAYIRRMEFRRKSAWRESYFSANGGNKHGRGR